MGAAVAGLWLAAMAVGLIAIPATAQELAPGGTFVDDDGSVHEGAIEAISAAGVTSGCTADRFCPDRVLTRGEMAAFLRRALVLPPAASDYFVDDSAHLFEAEINAIAEANVTLGCEPEKFCPNETMSRGQMASFLSRAFDLSPSDADSFVDDDGTTHEPAINAIASAGITTGCADSQFCPLARVVRQQMASFLARAMGLTPIVPPPRAPQLCRTSDAAAPTGRFLAAAGTHPALPGPGELWTYRVEVEDGLGIDPDCLATSVQVVLTSAVEGWGRSGARSFERIDSGAPDFIITVAFPSTTDSYCHPLGTGGTLSCWNGSRAMLNSWRWESGAAAYADVSRYRIYLINHEVGHAIGFGHRDCAGPGEAAPVMMQQTKGVGACAAHPWPLDWEL